MTNIVEKIEEIMKDNGLDRVKIYSKDSKCVVIQGNLNSTYTLTFKSEINEDDEEYYTVLKNSNIKRNITIWKQVNLENFPLIIESAKIYTAINSSNVVKNTGAVKNTSDVTKKYNYQLIMPITLTVGIILCSFFGTYLGNQIRNLCLKNENTELIR